MGDEGREETNGNSIEKKPFKPIEDEPNQHTRSSSTTEEKCYDIMDDKYDGEDNTDEDFNPSSYIAALLHNEVLEEDIGDEELVGICSFTGGETFTARKTAASNKFFVKVINRNGKNAERNKGGLQM